MQYPELTAVARSEPKMSYTYSIIHCRESKRSHNSRKNDTPANVKRQFSCIYHTFKPSTFSDIWQCQHIAAVGQQYDIYFRHSNIVKCCSQYVKHLAYVSSIYEHLGIHWLRCYLDQTASETCMSDWQHL